MLCGTRQAWAGLLVLAGILGFALADQLNLSSPFQEWTLEQSVQLLTDSPWARQETYTRVVGGVGSGVQGEKEIYTSFFVRFLSAQPVREAFARVQQIQHGYDELAPGERHRIDVELAQGLGLDVSRWLVVTVTFRSNDPDSEQRLRRFLVTETVETMRNRAYLTTGQQSRVELRAYFPPRGDGLGARFIFPRSIEGEPVVTSGDGSINFILDLPGSRPSAVSVTFPVRDMVIGGEIII